MDKITIKNNDLPDGQPVVLGYNLHNHQGIDIAINNSEIEKITIIGLKQNERKSNRIRIHLAFIYQSSYSQKLSLGSRMDNGKMKSLDGITNALISNIVSEKIELLFMSLRTEFEEEIQYE
ncbi:MAG: hypothetical protein ACQ9MH_20350 [Nitrospinales bacterium]